MTFAPDDIEIKEFVPTMRGYDRTEVRSFLRAVAEDVRRLEERLEDQSRRALENATSAVAAPVAQSRVESAPSALQDAIRELTEAVQLLAHQANASKTAEPTAVQSTGRTNTGPRGSVLLAGLGPQRSSSFAAERTAPAASTPSVPATWPNVERRSSQRPWSGRPRRQSTATTSSAPSRSSSTTNLAAEAVAVPRGENRELIAAFLSQALHPNQVSVDTDAVDTDQSSLRYDEVAEAPKTNVVPLMRAV